MSNYEKRKAIFENYRKNADLLVMQETHSQKENEEIWRNQWGGHVIYTHGTPASRGLAIFISKTIEPNISNVYTDDEGRLIILDIQENGVNITLIAIYAPNEDKPTFYRKIRDKLSDRSEHKIIIGDFNLTLDVDLDRCNTYCNNEKSKEEVENIMDEYSLKDVWRIQNPEKREYSWFKIQNPVKASRIDFALVSAGLDQRIKAVEYIPGIKTDHRALYILLQTSPNDRGRGYWKMNCNLLRNQEFLNMMEEEIQSSLSSTVQKPPQQTWEILKARIKKATIKFSRTTASETSLVVAELLEKVNEYEERLPLDEQEHELWQKTKLELEDKIMDKTKGMIFRSKVKWYEEGEKNTKYFYSLEKARYNAKTCYKLIDEEGQEIENQDKILEVQKSFYQNLYSKDEEVSFDMKNTSGIKVPKEIKQAQNQQIEIKEIEAAIKEMNNNKTPGFDGIPVDFYKVFWTSVKEPFMAMVNDAYEQQSLHSTAREGILNLIPKPKKDSRYIKNLRPITLLNTDYKIIEKVIANKMIPALKHIIHQDQRGFMQDRRISVNIRKMLDIMHQVQKEDIEAVILSLDFVKCFDKCSFTILHGSLDYFEFGDIIKEWTKILYKDFTVKIQNNGFFSESIPIKKGVHQGGCCSSVYFLVIAEILAISLRANQDITGISIAQLRNLLNQFADDMDIFSLAEEKSIKTILEELDKFRLQSGFTLSYEKTTLYRIGSLRHSDAQMYGIDQVTWSNNDINVLGVVISHDNIVEKNYAPIISKTKKIIEAWNHRNLSLIGKIQVVNTLIASLCVYKMMVLPTIPSNIIKNMDNLIRQYLWNGKKAKIAYSILQNPKAEGGLGLVNLKNKDIALKATWPKILSEEDEYAKLVYYQMKVTTIGQDIWRCSIHPEDVTTIGINNTFWEDVLKSWSNFNVYYNPRIDNQILWFNSKIKVRSRYIMWKDVYQKGLLYVYQLFQNMQFKTQEQVEQEYGLSIMRYNSLKKAIPKEWTQFFMTIPKCSYMPIAPHNVDTLVNTGVNISRMVYKNISDDVMIIHNKYLKWREDLGSEFQDSLVEFGQRHKDIYRVTNIAKYRSFQYRLLQRAIVTNIQLFKWKVISSKDCSFCGIYEETILHLGRGRFVRRRRTHMPQS